MLLRMEMMMREMVCVSHFLCLVTLFRLTLFSIYVALLGKKPRRSSREKKAAPQIYSPSPAASTRKGKKKTLSPKTKKPRKSKEVEEDEVPSSPPTPPKGGKERKERKVKERKEQQNLL